MVEKMSDILEKEVLSSMKKDELLEYAASVFKQDLPVSMNKDEMVSAILEMQGNVDESGSDDEMGEDKVKMYKLILNSDDKAGGNSPLPVGVNGKVWTIPRDVEVVVPEEVICVLKESVITISEHKGEDKDGKPIYEDRDVRRFSFSVDAVVD